MKVKSLIKNWFLEDGRGQGEDQMEVDEDWMDVGWRGVVYSRKNLKSNIALQHDFEQKFLE